MTTGLRDAAPTMPPFPTFPAPEDWYYAASAIYKHVVNPFVETLYERLFPHPRSVPYHADPLGRIVSAARSRMGLRHRRTPAYGRFLEECDRQREAAEKAAAQAAFLRRQARTAKERAEEEAFFADGGTAQEWAIEQEAREEAKAQTNKKRALARTRSKGRSTPRRTTNQQKATQ